MKRKKERKKEREREKERDLSERDIREGEKGVRQRKAKVTEIKK